MSLTKRVLLLFAVFMFLGTGQVFASCSLSSSASNILPNTSTALSITLNNTGTSDISWIKVPSNYSSVLTITSPSIQESGWNLDESTGDFIYSGTTLSSGGAVHLNVTVNAGDERPMDLTWFSSESPSGDPADSCNLSINITNTPEPTPTPVSTPVISSISLSIGNSSAILSWNTDSATTGTVNFGTSTNYGSTVTSSSSTSHSVTMPSLASSTTFHYQIQATGTGGTTTTSDASFTTSAASVTTTTTTTVTATVIVTPTPAPRDTKAPTIVLSTDFTKPFVTAPTITGKSTDTGSVNAGVASIEFSLDNGKNWLPVDSIESIGKKTTNFEFTPTGLVDGNYLLKVRAKDISGNTSTSKSHTMIIDRLPPMVGGSLFSLGPIILKPDLLGNIYSLAGLSIKMILSAVGGPTSIDLHYGPNKFFLKNNKESGLWSGEIGTSQTGSLPLIIKSIDGANNKTEKRLNSIITLAPGKIYDEQNRPLAKSKISIFTFEKTLNNFVLWDASPYEQKNPQETTESGEYHLLLPAGKYYLEVASPGKRKLRSEIFELQNATPINQDFYLEKSYFWQNFWAKTIPLSLSTPASQSQKQVDLTNTPVPDFDLSNSEFEFSNTSILGKPSVLSFITTWEPQTSDQLLALEKFKSENDGVNVIAVAVQESPSKINIFKKTGGYKLPIVADPDGTLVIPLKLGSLPTHIFIDKKGIIKDVNVGYLDTVNLLNRILK